MKCPECGNEEDKVVDSRESAEGDKVRRRRECLKCGARFTTYEYVEKTPLLVVKKDGRREPFERNKLLGGVVKACEKRPIGIERIEALVDDVERSIARSADKEISSKDIGELVMKRLHELDQIAYVRFASVYRQFRDINQFMNELKDLLDVEGGKRAG